MAKQLVFGSPNDRTDVFPIPKRFELKHKLIKLDSISVETERLCEQKNLFNETANTYYTQASILPKQNIKSQQLIIDQTEDQKHLLAE
jgi:hypothetical protein